MSDRKDISISIGRSKNIQAGVSSNEQEIQINLGGKNVYYCRMRNKTTEYWRNHATYIAPKNEIVVYSDHYQKDNVCVPGIKIGDGTTYVIDLPFVDDIINERFESILEQLEEHIENTDIHVTTDEKEFWDNKLNYEMNEPTETLIINRG